MNHSLLALALVLGAVSSAPLAHPAPSTSPAPQWDGVWRCKTDGQPNFDIVLSQEGHQIAGSILFYLHMRKDVHSPWIVTASGPGEPMFNLEQHGNLLSFEVSHRRAHPPRTLHDPPLHFEIRLDAPGLAELLHSARDPKANLKLTRSDY
jgi:hypothetical protein